MMQTSNSSSIDAATIRKATLSDAPQIARLLAQLGYPVSPGLVQRQLTTLLEDKAEDVLVAEGDDKKVIAFLAMHCIAQIAFEGGFARISYLCVDKEARSRGVGKELEQEACRLAAEKGCDRIELHCHARRTDAHGFYARQGYTESPKYFVKKLRSEATSRQSRIYLGPTG
jgi:N-acetylglutamate synthase-like GNAT family acetyltransferase